MSAGKNFDEGVATSVFRNITDAKRQLAPIVQNLKVIRLPKKRKR